MFVNQTNLPYHSSQQSNYNLLNTVAGGNVGNAWTPPFSESTFIISEGAATSQRQRSVLSVRHHGCDER